MNRDMIIIEDVEATGETDLALYCEVDDDEGFWVPKSLIDDDSEVYEKGHVGKLVIPLWFAEKNDLV